MPRMPGATGPKVTPVDDAPTPEALWAKFIDAIGGEEAIQRSGSRRTKGRFEVPMAQIKGSMETISKAPDLMVMTIDLGPAGVTRQGFDGTYGWTVDQAMGERLLEGEELDDLRRSGDITGSADFVKRASKATTLGKADFRGRETWVVELEGLFTNPATFYLDSNDGLIRGLRMTSKTAMGSIPVEIEVTDYKPFGKELIATRNISRLMGMEVIMTTDEVITEEIPASEFEPPAAIKALIEAKKQGAGAPAGGNTPAAPPSGTPKGNGGVAP